MKRYQIAHLAQGSHLAIAQNVVLVGSPWTGRTHVATALDIKAAQGGHRVQFATAGEWVARLQTAHQQSQLATELVKLRRYGLIVDEVGYIPFEQDAANLFFQLVSSRLV